MAAPHKVASVIEQGSGKLWKLGHAIVRTPIADRRALAVQRSLKIDDLLGRVRELEGATARRRSNPPVSKITLTWADIRGSRLFWSIELVATAPDKPPSRR